MKKIISFFIFAVTTIVMANATGSPKIIAKPSASLQKMWIDYGVTEDGRYGMMMHVAMTVYNMKDITSGLGLYFKYNDGQPDSYIKQRRKGDKYHTADGILAVGKDITPTYDASVYDDIQLFMPYDEFDLDPGTYDLTIDVQLNSKDGVGIAYLKLYDIEFTSYDKDRSAGSKSPLIKNHIAPTTGPRADFDSMWVDYDVTENNQLGMRLHFKFTAYELKDKGATVAVYFLYDDAIGGTIKDKNNQYTSASGNVAVYRDINPSYPEAIYDDFQLFMPYDELDLPKGKYNLLMDTKLIYKEGGLISNFTYYGFTYTQP